MMMTTTTTTSFWLGATGSCVCVRVCDTFVCVRITNRLCAHDSERLVNTDSILEVLQRMTGQCDKMLAVETGSVFR